MPNASYPSDHVPLVAEITYKSDKPTSQRLVHTNNTMMSNVSNLSGGSSSSSISKKKGPHNNPIITRLLVAVVDHINR